MNTKAVSAAVGAMGVTIGLVVGFAVGYNVARREKSDHPPTEQWSQFLLDEAKRMKPYDDKRFEELQQLHERFMGKLNRDFEKIKDKEK
jgi:uncharacterized membrane-anchored protein YhcB (DUF1043 family)